MAMSFPPQAFIIGAQKAATTSLAHLLGQHPAVTMSVPKEPHFFSHHWERGLDWYRGCFPGDGLLIDASTTYAMAPIHGGALTALDPPWGEAVPGRIARIQPEARFVYVLRSPAERTYSAYWHTVRYGTETRPFRQAIRENPNYLATSTYSRQIALYLRHFPLERFLFLDFAAVTATPDEAARRVLAFFGVDDDWRPAALERPLNRTLVLNGPGRAVRAVLGDHGLAVLSGAARAVVPRAVLDLAARSVARPVPKMAEEDRRFLEEYFAEEMERLREVTGLSLA